MVKEVLVAGSCAAASLLDANFDLPYSIQVELKQRHLSGVSKGCWTSVLSGKNSLSMSPALNHQIKALFGLLHWQDLPDCGLNAGADHELD